MIKQINTNSQVSTKINTICRVLGSDLSEKELFILCTLYHSSDNMQIPLTGMIREILSDGAGITDSNLSTILHRLTEKGLIARQNKTIILNPMFKDLDQLTGVLVKFE